MSNSINPFCAEGYGTTSVVAKEIIAKLRSNMKLESQLLIDLPITEYEVQMILDRHKEAP